MSGERTGRALVTGGAAGIGAAIAERLAADGYRVTVADRDGDAAAALAERIGGTPWAIDLLDVDALADLELDVDVLVNNAGTQSIAPIHEYEPEVFRRLVTLMLEAPFLLVRAALPTMYAQNFGRIIHVSSVHGVRASAFKSAYVAAKHGIEGLSKVTALEGGPHGVTSNCVNPAYVRTALVEGQIADQAERHGISADEVVEQVMLAHSSIKRLIEPAEVASLVSWLAGPDASMVTGTSHLMDGGWSAG